MTEDLSRNSDVLVIGGGPAGSTAASLLQSRGWTVTLLKKEWFPRFHIGESLLPRNMPIFRKLGVHEALSEIGVLKRAADFGHSSSSTLVSFEFSEAKAPDEPTAFQVLRSDLDELLLKSAAKVGVETLEGMEVTSVSFPQEQGVHVEARDNGGNAYTFSARFLVDASGRDTFLSSRLNLRVRNKSHNSAAVFGHFGGVAQQPGEAAGNISIYWFDYGWIWMIPLRSGVMSVGMVVWPKFLKMRNGSLEEFLRWGISMCKPAASRMATATSISDISATGNFSYRSKKISGERFVLVGDAFAFVDPVFSSGVYLAMQGAEFAAEAVDGCLREPRKARRYLRRYETKVNRGIKAFSWFIYRFTSPAMRVLFMKPTQKLGLQACVISVLSGDVFGRTKFWWELLAFKSLYYTFSLFLWRRS